MKASITRIIVASVAILLLSTSFESCKKGSGDPFISFRSRKARVAGEWKVSKLSLTSTAVSTALTGDVITVTTETENDGTKTTYTNTVTGQGVTRNIVKETFYYTFEKDGNFTYSTKNSNTTLSQQTVGNNGDQYNTTTNTETTIEVKGKWNFSAGVGEAKNKESLLLSKTDSVATSVSSTVFVAIDAASPAVAPQTSTIVNSSTPNNSEIWKISTLRNDKIVAEGKSHSLTDQTYNGNPNATKTEVDATFSIELDPK